MDNGPTDDDKNGKLITFPNGKSVDPDEVNADYVLSQTGDIPTPEILDTMLVDREVRDRVSYVKNQPLVKVLEGNASTADVIDSLIKEIAEELAHIKYDRRRAAKDGKPTLTYSLNRASGLKNLAELLFKRKEAALAERLDLRSPRFQKVFAVWMDFFYKSMEKCGVDDSVIDLVFQQMKADMKDWEDKMESV